MSNYTKTTNFAAKDSLPSGNAAKIVKGSEIDTEFNNIATASATKADIAGPTFTGTVTIPTVDLNGGAIDGTTVGASTAAAITGTTIVANTSINIAGDGATVTGIKDEDDMSSNSATKLATQQSIKAYVDSQVTAQDLDVTDGSASIDIDLDSESLGILGGTGIDSTASGTGVTLAIDSTVTTLTGTQTLTNKTLTSPTLNTPTIGTSFTIGSATITEAELEILDGATVTTAELNVLDGITSTTAELNILDGVTSTTAELNILDGVTSTAAELNILDGVTSTTAELNILDGVTSTTAELNILDGVTATTAELNLLDGVTATTAELNYVDGVTSNVQTQLDAKAPIDGATFTGTTTIPTADINGGAIDGTVIGGSSAAAGNFTTLGASGAITGTLGTAAQTNITSVGTLGSLTVSGDVTVDTNTLKVDSSNNRVGILNASPDVSLDIGSATDAMHVPVGTTAQRPGSPAAGYFRYNSTTGGFEGYTDAWGAIAGGGGGVAPSIDTMTGDGSDTTLALTNAPVNENATFVTIDGVTQHKSTYSVSGTTLTFSTAPPTGSAVEAITLNTTTINTASILQDADGDTKVQVEESSDEDKIRFDTAGTERMIIDSTGVGIGTSSIASGGSNTQNVQIHNSTANSTYLKLSTSGTGATASDGVDLIVDNSGNAYFWNRENASTLFATNNTERMRVTDTGAVGLGVSSPDGTLHVHTASAGTVAASSQADDLVVENSAETGITIISPDDQSARIRFTSPSTNNDVGGAHIFYRQNINKMNIGTTVSGGTMTILSGAANETMTLDSSGNVAIGSSSATARLEVTGAFAYASGANSLATSVSKAAARIRGSSDATTSLFFGSLTNDAEQYIQSTNHDGSAADDIALNPYGGHLFIGCTALPSGGAGGAGFETGQSSGRTIFQLGTTTTSAAEVARFYNPNGNVGNITLSGSATAFNTSSDYRLKENVVAISNATDRLKQLKPSRFNFIADADTTVDGFLAHEVQDVVPEAITGTKDAVDADGNPEYQGIDQSKLVPLLVATIQELEARLTALENN